MSNKSIESLSDIIVFTKYAKYLAEEQRRESFLEIVERNKDMHKKHYAEFPEILEKIDYYYDSFVATKKVLPSMRSMQFGGKPIEVNPARIFNCAFAPADHYKVFNETMFLLLGGTGMGYSVQFHHVEKLPAITVPNKTRRFLIGDSIEGWADAVKALVEAFMRGKSLPRFDYSDIRAKGERLVTSGGKAPGPEPLKNCLSKMQMIFERKKQGEKLRPIEVHDLLCHIADAVLAGGIRRAALIALFSLDDYEMLTSKTGQWWELNSQRGRANNSAVILRHRIKLEDFNELWNTIRESKCGEPGFIFTNNADWGANPCVEIGLRPNQFCNLVETNASGVTSQEEAEARVEAAAFIGTLQAGYTDFHYLRDVWQRTTEKDALIGVSWTGIASGSLDNIDLSLCANKVTEINLKYSRIIGTNPSARSTCVKPAGTTSLVLGTSSGIHGWHGEYFIRRVRIGKNEAIYPYLLKKMPELIEDEFFNPKEQAVISFPLSAPKDAKFRNESALELLNRVQRFSKEWVAPAFHSGDQGHNVSATISIREDEWEAVRYWMWHNRDTYNGLSVLPYDGGSYKQAPFEEIDKATYEKMTSQVSDINLKEVLEVDDTTDLQGEVACAGGACELVL